MSDDLHSKVVDALRVHLKSQPTAEAAPVAVTPEPSAAKPLVLKTGESAFSDVFGYVPDFGDFAVVKRETPTDPEVARLIPHVDPDYVLQKKEAATLVAGLMDGDKTLITGPTGSGKSSLVKHVCALLNWPFIRINMSGDVESSHIFGTREIHDGATVWADGPVAEAVKYGAVCLVDEWELMPAEIAMGMQNILEDGGFLYLKEKPGTSADRTYVPHANFRLVFAGNTVGQGDVTGAFNGVGVQNTATIDRFTNTLRIDYLSPEHEVAVITGKSDVAKKTATNMVKLAGLIRSAYQQGKLGLTMSPRTLINWGRKQQRYSVKDAFMVSFATKLTDDDKVSVNELYVKVFGV